MHSNLIPPERVTQRLMYIEPWAVGGKFLSMVVMILSLRAAAANMECKKFFHFSHICNMCFTKRTKVNSVYYLAISDSAVCKMTYLLNITSLLWFILTILMRLDLVMKWSFIKCLFSSDNGERLKQGCFFYFASVLLFGYWLERHCKKCSIRIKPSINKQYFFITYQLYCNWSALNYSIVIWLSSYLLRSPCKFAFY